MLSLTGERMCLERELFLALQVSRLLSRGQLGLEFLLRFEMALGVSHNMPRPHVGTWCWKRWNET
jgi:hypothetical protein